ELPSKRSKWMAAVYRARFGIDEREVLRKRRFARTERSLVGAAQRHVALGDSHSDVQRKAESPREGRELVGDGQRAALFGVRCAAEPHDAVIADLTAHRFSLPMRQIRCRALERVAAYGFFHGVCGWPSASGEPDHDVVDRSGETEKAQRVLVHISGPGVRR